MNTEILIFSGFNMRAVYAFIRTLKKDKLPYSIIASSKEDEIFKTSYKKDVVVTRKYKNLVLDDIVSCISEVRSKSQSKKFLIAPSTEALNRFLLEHKTYIENIHCFIPLVEQSQYIKISDKYSFGRLCKTYSINTPKEYSLETIKLPCVAKPKHYKGLSSSQISKPVLIMAKDQLQEFLKNYKVEDFYFQEFLEGRSLYLLYYFYKDGSFMKYSQENFIQQSEGRSILAAKNSNFHLSKQSIPYEKLFKSIDYTGLVMIEVKKTMHGVYMIEANPRFWGPSQLFVDAGVNFFEAMLYDYGLLLQRPIENITHNNPISYFWNDGSSYLKNNIDSISFHNYTKKQFISEYSKWEKVNLLNREDTSEVHKGLIKGNK